LLTRLSPEIRVMLRPERAFSEPCPAGGRWLYWRRPLLLLLILCSGISLLATGRFSLHVVGSAAIYWSLLPLAEIVGLAAVRRKWPEAPVVDRFFTGHGPWLLFIIAFAAFGSAAVLNLWVAAAVAVLMWSCWIDYRFFASVGKLVLHRAVSWTLFAMFFAGSWMWMEIQRL
jgi:hypothetical protein